MYYSFLVVDVDALDGTNAWSGTLDIVLAMDAGGSFASYGLIHTYYLSLHTHLCTYLTYKSSICFAQLRSWSPPGTTTDSLWSPACPAVGIFPLSLSCIIRLPSSSSLRALIDIGLGLVVCAAVALIVKFPGPLNIFLASSAGCCC